VPEEINRRIIDHIADFNLVYTEHARRHLISEGLPHRRIYLTGSPMWEVLLQNMDKINNSDVLERLNKQLAEEVAQSNTVKHCEPKKYFMVSVHREENVDNPENLRKILTILNNLSETYKLPVIVSTHPRTRKRIESLDSKIKNQKSRFIHFMKPFGFTDYVHLQMNALCTISDSGTISEESAMLKFPAISLRQSMERPEAQDAGSIILTGFEPDIVLNAIAVVINEDKTNKPANLQTYQPTNIPNEYLIENTSLRVLILILGNTKLSNKWWGINE
jgi:UDP-N-acetylglucosamine 2-epimerase (non-hydrolysing)